MTCNPNIKDKKAVWSVEEVTDARCKICFYGVFTFTCRNLKYRVRGYGV